MASTIKSASTYRVRLTQSVKPPPIPAAQRAKKAAERERVQQDIDAAVDEWFTSTNALANTLADRFNKKPRYFLDIFFHGGARMLTHHEKVNPKNAFVAMKAQELRSEGQSMPLLEIQNTFKEEYENLDEDEREAVVQEFKESQQAARNIRRPSPRARIQEVSNTVRNIKLLIDGLRNKAGIEGFFCIVRNNADYHMAPQWYFTSEAISNYMPLVVRKKWDTHDIGIKLEAFAIAGCDRMNLCTTAKKKAEYIKNQIQDRIGTMLVDITGNAKAIMHYTNYEVDIVQRYNVVLEGWTYENLVNPSELSNSLPPLKALLSAMDEGTCRFVKLTAAQAKEREAAYDAKVVSGDIIPRTRKRRSDAGSKKSAKRPRKGKTANSARNGSDDEMDGGQGPKSAEMIENSD